MDWPKLIREALNTENPGASLQASVTRWLSEGEEKHRVLHHLYYAVWYHSDNDEEKTIILQVMDFLTPNASKSAENGTEAIQKLFREALAGNNQFSELQEVVTRLHSQGMERGVLLLELETSRRFAASEAEEDMILEVMDSVYYRMRD